MLIVPYPDRLNLPDSRATYTTGECKNFRAKSRGWLTASLHLSRAELRSAVIVRISSIPSSKEGGSRRFAVRSIAGTDRLLVFAMIIAPDRRPDGRIEKIGEHAKSGRLRLSDVGGAHRSSSVRIVHHERAFRLKALAN